MGTLKETPASVEFVAEYVEKLRINFYKTPEKLFDALMKTILFFEMSERDVNEHVLNAIYSIKRLEINIADILNGYHERPVYPKYFD